MARSGTPRSWDSRDLGRALDRRADWLSNQIAQAHSELEALIVGLSICTFCYVPAGLEAGSEKVEGYLNELNTELLARVQRSGEAYVSNAVVAGKYALRACVVNFRTSLEDVEELPRIVTFARTANRRRVAGMYGTAAVIRSLRVVR